METAMLDRLEESVKFIIDNILKVKRQYINKHVQNALSNYFVENYCVGLLKKRFGTGSGRHIKREITRKYYLQIDESTRNFSRIGITFTEEERKGLKKYSVVLLGVLEEHYANDSVDPYRKSLLQLASVQVVPQDAPSSDDPSQKLWLIAQWKKLISLIVLHHSYYPKVDSVYSIWFDIFQSRIVQMSEMKKKRPENIRPFKYHGLPYVVFESDQTTEQTQPLPSQPNVVVHRQPHTNKILILDQKQLQTDSVAIMKVSPDQQSISTRSPSLSLKHPNPPLQPIDSASSVDYLLPRKMIKINQEKVKAEAATEEEDIQTFNTKVSAAHNIKLEQSEDYLSQRITHEVRYLQESAAVNASGQRDWQQNLRELNERKENFEIQNNFLQRQQSVDQSLAMPIEETMVTFDHPAIKQQSPPNTQYMENHTKWTYQIGSQQCSQEYIPHPNERIIAYPSAQHMMGHHHQTPSIICLPMNSVQIHGSSSGGGYPQRVMIMPQMQQTVIWPPQSHSMSTPMFLTSYHPSTQIIRSNEQLSSRVQSPAMAITLQQNMLPSQQGGDRSNNNYRIQPQEYYTYPPHSFQQQQRYQQQ